MLDADLFAACDAARAATAAFEVLEHEEYDQRHSDAIDRECAAIVAVTKITPQTARGLAAKAAALSDYLEATSGCTPSDLAVDLAFALAANAVEVARAIMQKATPARAA